MRLVIVRLSGLTLNGYLDEGVSLSGLAELSQSWLQRSPAARELRVVPAGHPEIQPLGVGLVGLSWKGRGLSDRILEGSATSASQT
jgi:hypothetical protein